MRNPANIVDEIAHRIKRERTILPALLAAARGELSDDDLVRLAQTIKLNTGRAPEDATALDNQHRADALEHYLATRKSRRFDPDACAETQRLFATMPSGATLTLTALESLIKKGHRDVNAIRRSRKNDPSAEGSINLVET